MATFVNTYSPRIISNSSDNQLTACAMVGINSVVMGWSVPDNFDRKDLLGFAIKKTVFEENGLVRYQAWLEGNKRFDFQSQTALSLSSEEAPFQRFVWNDYTLNSNFSYSFEIFPLLGDPKNPTKGKPAELSFKPSFNDDGQFGLYTNRGVTAAQVYLRDFGKTNPKESREAQKWLSRDLKESLIRFINQAQAGDKLHCAIYEFEDEEVAAAFEAATQRHAEVMIVYHAKNQERKEKNEHTLNKYHLLPNHAKARTKIQNISHNKFVVLLKNGLPKAVWTGTCNFTFNGFFLQTNMATEISHPTTADAYNKYFEILVGDPDMKGRNNPAKASISDLIMQTDAALNNEGWKVNFSPISKKHLLEKSADLIKQAKSAVLFSAPFGLDQVLVDELGLNASKIIEYGLVNNTAKAKIEKLHFANTRFYTPTRLDKYAGIPWDAKAFGSHKIHTKSLVIDPWSSDSKLIVGTGNFSDEACTDNDENFLIIEGNQRISAIIATEFIRMWEHYKNRWFISQLNTDPASIPQLDKTGTWSDTAYNVASRSYKFREREVFTGRE
ncbi:MAG: hypothetical protein IPO04_13260 [Cytophagaceae bacterium]|nr:hypothetical protein [Cytophagaceae bacterium]